MQPIHGHSDIIGILLFGLGTLIVLLAFIRYKRYERHKNSDTYQASSILAITLTRSILAISIFLVLYFIQSR